MNRAMEVLEMAQMNGTAQHSLFIYQIFMECLLSVVNAEC